MDSICSIDAITLNIKPQMENQSKSSTFTMIVKIAKVKNAMSAVTSLLDLILAKYL